MPFVLAFAVAVALIPLAARAAVAVGLVDRPGAPVPGAGATSSAMLKIHDRPVPLAGGVPIVVAALAIAAALGEGSPWLWAAAAVACVAGLVDDARPLPPWVRVQALLLAGVLLAAGRWAVDPLGALAVVGTVVLVVATTNAMNLIDGQDALAGGVAVASASGIAAATAVAGGDGVELPFALAGATAAFLVFNLPPARVFLGNAGAYGVGVVLAAAATRLTEAAGWPGLAAAALCLAVPAGELTFTVVRRLRAGVPLAAGDRDHGYDLLSRRWGSRTRATAAFVAIAAVGSAAGVALVATTT